VDVKRWIITGWRGVGKTTFCQRFLQVAQAQGWDVAGILSLAVFEGAEKVAIDALDIRSGERRNLAAHHPHAETDSVVTRWFFDQHTLAWGNHILEDSAPCQVLVVDELGPLEFIQHKGWVKAMEVIEKGDYHLGLIVVRPELLEVAAERFQPTRVIEIHNPGEIEPLIQQHLPEWLQLIGS